MHADASTVSPSVVANTVLVAGDSGTLLALVDRRRHEWILGTLRSLVASNQTVRQIWVANSRA